MTTALATIQPGGLTTIDPEVFRQAAAEMADAYHAAECAMRTHLNGVQDATASLREIFPDESHYSFAVDHSCHSRTYYGKKATDEILAVLRREAWQLLVRKLGVRDIMSVAKRKEFDEQLEKGDLPEITAQSVIGMLIGLTSQATQFATEAAREVFEILRPSQHAHNKKYKVNSAFRVGKRVVLSWFVEQGYGAKKFRPNHYREQQLVAIDNVFHLLDGKGTVRDGRPPLVQAILDSTDGTGSTDYFSFRCCKNRNIHLTFKRLDLVKKLNGLAVGSYELGEEEDA